MLQVTAKLPRNADHQSGKYLDRNLFIRLGATGANLRPVLPVCPICSGQDKYTEVSPLSSSDLVLDQHQEAPLSPSLLLIDAFSKIFLNLYDTLGNVEDHLVIYGRRYMGSEVLR